MNLFTSQQRGQVPVAPIWSRQTAANWEPSVQTVGNLGGHTIAELLLAIQTKWPFLFRIQQVLGCTTFKSGVKFYKSPYSISISVRLLRSGANSTGAKSLCSGKLYSICRSGGQGMQSATADIRFKAIWSTTGSSSSWCLAMPLAVTIQTETTVPPTWPKP